MWALQQKTGEAKGAFPWLNFKNEPWEADDSQFFGASLAAIAVATAPGSYRSHLFHRGLSRADPAPVSAAVSPAALFFV
jgi:hypothetical protein